MIGIIIGIILYIFSGCSMKKKEVNLDTKIGIELKYLDKEFSSYISTITNEIKTKYGIIEEETKVKSNQKGESETKTNSDQNSNNNEISIMSMHDNKQAEKNQEYWSDIKNNIENLYTSWIVIQNDVKSKNILNEDELNEMNKGIDNLLTQSINKNQIDFIIQVVELYKYMIKIAEKINYDNNVVYILNTKEKIYESYCNVLNDEWDKAQENMTSAYNYLQNLNYIQDKEKLIFKNSIFSIEQKDKKVFFIKYSNVINDLNL